MMLEIEGARTTDDGWNEAYALTVERLRELVPDDEPWPTPDDPASVRAVRRRYAVERSASHWVEKCAKLGRLASDWIKQAGYSGEIVLVRLRCLRGRFDLHVAIGEELHTIEVREELFDDLILAGSREALASLDRLFAANLGRFPLSKAS